MNAEITWDSVMSDDMTFIEGCYRLDHGSWQVVTAAKGEEYSQAVIESASVGTVA